MIARAFPDLRPATRENLPVKLTLAEIDASCRWPVLWFICSGVFWLLVGSLLAMIASIKMHSPGFLAGQEWLTFGRVRPAHLNAITYGWSAMAGIGVVLWLQARLSRVRLVFPQLLTLVAILWNLAVATGLGAILAGYGTSVEWLEFPLPVAGVLAVLFSIFGLISFYTFVGRRSEHVYVSQWYIFGAILWFPFLYVVANFMILAGGTTGVVQASANWWYGHNVLGLFLTPIGLATIYYLIPKVIGRPIHSYYLSLLGFWALALFYNWAGTHHLVGGPLPAWMITVGIVGSMMMFVSVIAVGINHHMTMRGHFHLLRGSPTLRFVVFGGMAYTLVSFQGSIEALRSVNEVTHFTHFTIAHAHLGVYGFYSMAIFGAIYYILPRMTEIEWSSAALIKTHFWGSALGVSAYFVALTIGGWTEGLMQNDANIPFLTSVKYTVPYLWSRSVAGSLMTLAHVALGISVARMLAAMMTREAHGWMGRPRGIERKIQRGENGGKDTEALGG
jgi:cytochrome c oxidase cbb3-type subunit 1